MASFDRSPQLPDMDKASRQHRVGRYKVWLLQKRLAELSAQVEAAVLEARQLIAWKHGFQPLTIAELTEDDRRILEHNHRIRLAEVVLKHCSGALKSITQHKWAFPFNSPVDTTRFPDYPKVITHPMDFSTIRARLDGGYYRDPKDWWNDVMLVFSNAKRYNAPGSDCYLMAQTLQEVSEEKYDKVIAPRLAEEAATMLREEIHLKKKRAELVNQQMSEAMDAQCAVLFGLMAELHAAIREAKLLASSLCEPLTLEEKQALAATIQGLPTAQLESVVAFVASRHPSSVSHSEVQPGSGAGGPNRKVQLNLGRYDPLLLRQLQHLASTCTAVRQPPVPDCPPGVMPPLRIPSLRPASPTPAAAAAALAAASPTAAAVVAAGAAVAVAEQVRSASASPSPSPCPAQQAAALPTASATDAAGATGSVAAPGPAAWATAGGAGTAPVPQPQQPQAMSPGTEPAADGVPGGSAQQEADTQQQQEQRLAERLSEQAEGTRAAAAVAAGTAPSGPAAAAAATPALAQPPVTSTQRNISDVVTNATANGISMRAGIRWPGLAVGAGVRPRARALLSLHLDGPASAAEFVAACPLPCHLPQRVPLQARSVGLKRRMAQVAQRLEQEEDQPAAWRREEAVASPATVTEELPQAQELGTSTAGGEAAGAGGSGKVGACREGMSQQPASNPGASPMEVEQPEAVPSSGQDAVQAAIVPQQGFGAAAGAVLGSAAGPGAAAGGSAEMAKGSPARAGSELSGEVPPLVLDLGTKPQA